MGGIVNYSEAGCPPVKKNLLMGVTGFYVVFYYEGER